MTLPSLIFRFRHQTRNAILWMVVLSGAFAKWWKRTYVKLNRAVNPVMSWDEFKFAVKIIWFVTWWTVLVICITATVARSI